MVPKYGESRQGGASDRAGRILSVRIAVRESGLIVWRPRIHWFGEARAPGIAGASKPVQPGS
jgi:hypothetical protein